MAVYTPVTEAQLDKLLADYDLGRCIDLKGIDGGIENTNYFVTLEADGEQTQYVLTLFEEFSYDEMPFFVELGKWLAERGVPVPYAIEDRNGIGLKQLNGRPAFLQPRFHGGHVDQQDLTPAHCASIGTALAKLHLAGKDFFLTRQAHRGVFWWRRESASILPRLSQEDAALLSEEVRLFDELREQHADEMPMGIIHGDLFHDNALFVGENVDAILDIYNAATAYLLFDLAIVANDWCVNPDGSIDTARERALLDAYAAVRPFEAIEKQVWPQLCRTAAMRFWLSRLIPWLGISQASRQGGEMKLKDPDELKRILLSRIKQPSSL
ncbi:homoserine kinase [Marinobacterium lutimaris]|uniref:Homoserine kinase n=1 Tax=Marinobacterium lutimaris TaxID=568106 RepID=A0A1H6DEA4_9GAMM|nr:homoserine kinase [Marinobacterium lutimaris]SEG83708.1 homoserine kinase [Marinobacterium lutimaris]